MLLVKMNEEGHTSRLEQPGRKTSARRAAKQQFPDDTGPVPTEVCANDQQIGCWTRQLFSPQSLHWIKP
jgi:hypothetical protein